VRLADLARKEKGKEKGRALEVGKKDRVEDM